MQDLQEDPTLGRIGGFRLIRRLATGGTSDVLLARAEGPNGFERTVVLKRLLSEHQDDPEFARMFTREASAYSRLSHPAIVRLFDFFTWQRQLIMVLEFIDGVSLARLMQATLGAGRTLDDRASLFVACRVFDALAAAHAARDPETGDFAAVIHRDINPANVLIPWDGHVKLTDFGIAKIVGTEGETKTGVGGIKGTYGYMAPEQVTGDRVTARTDVYAASIVLWELLARKKAIQSDKLPEMEILRAMAEPKIPSLDALRPDLSPVLREAIARGLEPNPRSRAISAEEMVSVLRDHMTSLEDARNALVASLGPLRRQPLSIAPPDASLSDTATAPQNAAAVLATAERLALLDEDTRAVPSAEMLGILNVPPEPPTRPQLGSASSALQAVEAPLRRLTPSGLRAVSSSPPAMVPQAPRPPSRPTVSSHTSQATLARGASASNPDLSGAMERAPVSLSAQHVVLEAEEDLAATHLRTPSAPPVEAPLPSFGSAESQPLPAFGRTAAMPAVELPPATVRQTATLALSATPAPLPPSLQPVAPVEPPQAPQPPPPEFASPLFAPPFDPARAAPNLGPPSLMSPAPAEPAPAGRTSALPLLIAAGAMVAVVGLGAVGFLLVGRAPPKAVVITTASAVAPVKSAPPARSAAPARAASSPTPSTASAPPAASSAPSAVASSVASAPPAATASAPPRPSATIAVQPVATATTASPSVDSAHGLIRLPSWSTGRRVWIDGKLAGEGPDPKVAVCGAREVKIGSSGDQRLVNVPCGGEVELAPH